MILGADTMYNFDYEEETSAKSGHGKKPNQRMKHFLVLQYLMQETDQDHPATVEDITEYLKSQGIYAERRSVYKDIKEINIAMRMTDRDDPLPYDEAKEYAEDEPEENVIAYKHKSGYYVQKRLPDFDTVKLISECIYSAKFIPESQCEYLIEDISSLLSIHQREKLKCNVRLVGRVRSQNKAIRVIIDTVNDAIKHKQKISFKYQKYVIQDPKKQVERRHGEQYVVSPFELILNDGNYYLLSYDDKKKDIRTYRVDRMKDVCILDEKREGTEKFREINLDSYIQRVFSMYGGENKRVKLVFINSLLDSMIDRFGTKDVFYGVEDDKHSYLSAYVEVSDQFFGWLLGFGRRVRLVEPSAVVEDFKGYLDKIRGMY